MPKKFLIFVFTLTIITIVFSDGCSSDSKNNKIAYVSSNTDSEYEKTFKELQLGTLFDFNLKLPNADKSWVKIWVEGYSNGKAVKPFPLIQLSYGLSPTQVDEGHMGFGIINPNSNEPQFFLYSEGVKTAPNTIDNNFFAKSAVTGWEYAVGSKPIGLKPGEEAVLAVYRQGKDSLRTGYDYKNQDSINEMINDHITVLILKIKVVEKNSTTIETSPADTSSSAQETSLSQEEFIKKAGEKGLTEAKVHSLENIGLSEQEILNLSSEKIAEIFAPGALNDGVPVFMANDEQIKELQKVSIDSGMSAILGNLGYTYEEMLKLSEEERDFIFPNTELMSNLEQKGFSEEKVNSLLRQGKTYRAIIKEALKK